MSYNFYNKFDHKAAIVALRCRRVNQTFGVQPLEIQTHSLHAFFAIFGANNDPLGLHPLK